MNGRLLIAGGNIGATEQGKRDILGRFTALSGGKRGKILVVPCASGDPVDSAQYICGEFLSTGIGVTVTLPLTEDPDLLKGRWTDRADEKLFPLFEGVTGVWFTGGDQLRTTRLLLKPDGSDTPVLQKIRSVLDRGGVVGGTSAGAAIMSRTMIARGDEEGVLTLPHYPTPEGYPDSENTPEPLVLTRGLGFLPWGIVDQHFNRRPRLQRLLAAMELSDESLGWGISEDTALEADLTAGTLRVHGSAYVMRALRTPSGITLNRYTAAEEAVKFNL